MRNWGRRRTRPRTDGAPATQETHAEQPSGPPTVAAITMTSNEGAMLRRWVDHYGTHVGREHLIVLDDNSTDGSTEDLDCTVHHLPPLPGKAQFATAWMRLMSGIAQGLLAVYDYVIFTDVDEFLIPDPAYGTLPELIAAKGRPPVMASLALNVVHLPQAEGPLDLAAPILDQRSYAKFTRLMCKPSIKRVPAPWTAATHGIRTAAPYAVDPDLFMVHLKFADRDRLAAIAEHRKAVNEADGRANKSTWSQAAEELLAAFDRAVADVDVAAVPDFDPSALDLASLVIADGDCHRAPKQGQLNALRDEPLVRIPERLKGLL